jgi:molybdate-binding protein/DNA-binding transcriptional regulator YhcF (GntR family)
MAGAGGYVYVEIAEAIRRLILSGELSPGARLPSVRDMAGRWRCTPATVARAYSLLADEGLVLSRRGGGTRVADARIPAGGALSAQWQWADLVHRAEAYLLESLSAGHTPAHAEAALAAAIARWQELRARPQPGDGRGPSRRPRPGTLRFAGSHDLCVELLSRSLAEHAQPVAMTTDFVGSLGGLIALARGEADLAGAHLWDEATGLYNVPFVQRVLPNVAVVLVNLVKRLQGLIVPAGNPQALRGFADLARPGVVFVNRQSGSGTRVWLDVQLRNAGVDPARVQGYDQEESTHLGVARAVAEGRATAGLGIWAAAGAYGLDFVPLGEERFDLIVPAQGWAGPAFEALRAVLGSAEFRAAVTALGGYDVSETGAETRLG